MCRIKRRDRTVGGHVVILSVVDAKGVFMARSVRYFNVEFEFVCCW